MNDEILTYEDLQVITKRTHERTTKAQVIADLTAMKMTFRINARGYPVSSKTAYNRYLGIKSRDKLRADTGAQSDFEVLSSVSNG